MGSGPVGCGRKSSQAREPIGDVMKAPKDLGMMVLAAWLVLFGVLSAPFLKVSFSHSGDVLAVLAIVAGVLLFMRR